MKLPLLLLSLVPFFCFSETVFKVPQKTYFKSISVISTDQEEIITPSPTIAQCSTNYLQCLSGIAEQTSLNGSALVTWSCTLNQDIKNCERPAQSKANNGVCVDYSSQQLSQEPTNLCETNYGSTIVTNSQGALSWSCLGEAGTDTIEKGNDVNCSAPLAVNNQSCLSILESGSSVGNGNYDLSVNGNIKSVYCDMTGGGWTLYDEFSSVYNARKPLNYTIENTNDLTNAGYLYNIDGFLYNYSDNYGTVDLTNGYKFFFAIMDSVGHITFTSPKNTIIKISYSNPYNNSSAYCSIYLNNVVKETLNNLVFSDYITEVEQGDEIKIVELNAGACAIDAVWIK